MDFAALAARTAGYSGDDITGVCRDAAMNSLRRQIRGKSQAELVAMRDQVAHEPVNMDDFLQACPACPPDRVPLVLTAVDGLLQRSCFGGVCADTASSCA